MKNENVVAELNYLLDLVVREQQKRKEKLNDYLTQFTTEEQKLRKRQENETNDGLRSKLNNQLDLVKAGYELLESNRLAGQVQRFIDPEKQAFS